MQQALTKKKWGLLVAFVAVLALASSLFMAKAPAFADDLVAGDAALSTQTNNSTQWPLRVSVKHDDKSEVVASYMKSEFSNLASKSTALISGLSTDGTSLFVTTAVQYVTLEDLMADAGVVWAPGASITYTNTYTNKTCTFTYEQVSNMYFYPSAPNKKQMSDRVKTGLVFGMKSAENQIVGDGSTAGAVQKTAAASSTVDEALLPVSGSLQSDYTTLSGATMSADRFISGINDIVITYPETQQSMHRLYNPNSGEHFYTASESERDNLVRVGWRYEGVSWNAPLVSNVPVYRLYNSHQKFGDHHYTTSKAEYDNLVKIGWTGEGIGWYSDFSKEIPLYRLYNPNAYPSGASGAHHYTSSTAERDALKFLGWRDEGTAWYGLK